MDVAGAEGALTGERYRRSLDDGREVWLAGERVRDVAGHPAFAGTVAEFGRLYDRQHDPALAPRLTFPSPDTGNPVSRSYQLPTNAEELRAKAENTRDWMRASWGQLGRAPDFMANVTVGLHDFRDELEANHQGFGENAVAYHRYAREHDLALTHALGDPQIDRSSSALEDQDLALRVVRETDNGVVVRGAKQLATLAPFAHEVLVYLNGVSALRGSERFVIWFALPMNARGLRVLCREPLGDHRTGHGHPFARRFDEQDAMLFFEDVEIPWERIFLLRDGPLALRGLSRINAWSMLSTHIRFHERLRTIAATGSLVAQSVGVDAFRGIQEDLGELVSYVETLRIGIEGSLATGGPTPGGLYAPGESYGLGFWSAGISARAVEIVRRVGASGVVMQPSEADLAHPELRPLLDRYMRGKNIDAAAKSRLFRLAWDLVADGFGARQEMYEYLHRGDLGAGRVRLYRSWSDRGELEERLRGLLAQPIPTSPTVPEGTR
ncbi:4-hydroxyphenylacetate 3-hydroxylase family protein [Streptomyces profundus]|uniref:4-hydroxyphenylacetate 3-hydroxylase family protein n=1 Tax=Streptomyces profundus TaxID=2867410 RepID=UPI001D15F96E|nr:4-hydroxyphenylacetate 3-hydroxylase N-terminal domain-containing protein [Streptomyces sp. MA3_2.13]UED83244.1 4-hydroxyphenylacetate 3-hydroxylase [Streptomyces sp. MA3_2.13]